MRGKFILITIIVLITLATVGIAYACPPVPTPTSMIPTTTPVTPTITSVIPTITPVMPTSTPVTPTVTPIMSTETPTVTEEPTSTVTEPFIPTETLVVTEPPVPEEPTRRPYITPTRINRLPTPTSTPAVYCRCGTPVIYEYPCAIVIVWPDCVMHRCQ